MDDLKVFSGNSNPALTDEICRYLSIRPGDVAITQFQNQNIKVKIKESVRGQDVFVVQTSCPPVNEGIMELLIMIDALKRASAGRITAVCPYFPYTRSDKKDEPRISITARLMADLLQTAGADRVLTMNLHSDQIQGFFRIPVDQLDAGPIICNHFRKKNLSNFTVVSTDAGRARWAATYAAALELPLAICDKRRIGDKQPAKVVNVIGDVKGRYAAIFDDEILTGGTICSTVEALQEFGVLGVHVSCVHGVLEGGAIEKLEAVKPTELIVTNTVPLPPHKDRPFITKLSVAELFAKAIRNIHERESVSILFKTGEHKIPDPFQLH
ncbi:MAG TPA: ribose-phosphate pyrophosphokinase [Candidatus Brocadiia bacterium]|nr:ribose-phosphate pyrophosphokinase [Candidatus Brocadiia bacterium]